MVKTNNSGGNLRSKKPRDYSKAVPFTAVLAERCISAIAEELVLDHFIGSGNIIIAAEKLNWLWVDIDQSPDYASLAAQRIGKMLVIIDDPMTPPA